MTPTASQAPDSAPRDAPRDLAGVPALVTGASRGFGRAVAVALAGAGAAVTGVARDGDRLREAAGRAAPRYSCIAADAADPVTAGRLTDLVRPRILVLCAGATPLARPVHQQTWESFSAPWETDVRQAFHWVREALTTPLDPGSVVIAFSSGAALGGSPLSGGYAGAKAAIRFLAGYAAQESARAGLGIRVTSVLPDLTPDTDLGAAAVAAYAARQGVTAAAFAAARGALLTAEQVGKAITGLAADPGLDAPAYRLTAAGLEALA